MNPLTQAQIDEHNERGFLLVKGFVSLSDIQKITKEIEGVHEKLAAAGRVEGLGLTWEDLPEGVPPLIRQLMGSHNLSPTIRSLAASPRLIGAIEQLLGEPAELFHSKLMMKAARCGSFTPWHSDWGYWKTTFTRPAQMNAFLAIDASTLANGCIRYVPGSHKEYIEHTVFESRSGFEIGLPGDIDAFPNEPLEMQPGDVAFHGSITIHASEGNQSDHSRVMNTFAYTAKGILQDSERARKTFEGQTLKHDLIKL
ncbi:MAG: phytanoyl-CoA dioxygenase family protein [Verrucomicrobia bacterium]|nr:phytanoyl-CoA dioxygenase family protein [Verrucomicrobiota bacterium]